MKDWIDTREPPESLVALARSKDFNERKHAADHLGYYAHEKSFAILFELLDDEHSTVRRNAICSLVNIVSYDHLSSRWHIVGEAIANHLEIKDDRFTASRFIGQFVDSQFVLDKLLGCIQNVASERETQKSTDFLDTLLNCLLPLKDFDRDYAARKILSMGLPTPGVHPSIMRCGLRILYKLNPITGLVFAKQHLSDERHGGFTVRSYCFNGIAGLRSRSIVRITAGWIVSQIAINAKNLDTMPSKKIWLEALKLLIQLERLPKKGKCPEYRRNESSRAYQSLRPIYDKNPAALTQKFLGQSIFNSLPDYLRTQSPSGRIGPNQSSA